MPQGDRLARDTISALLARRGPALRVVVAEVRGSAPREVGTAMPVRIRRAGHVGRALATVIDPLPEIDLT